jgi:hypothetical protein
VAKEQDVTAPAFTADVTLVVGTYTLTVTGKTTTADVAVGTKEGLVISKDENLPVSVTLGPKTEAGAPDGTFSYEVTIPTGAAGTLTITTLADAVVGEPMALTAGENTDSLDLPPGSYWLAVSLKKEGKTAGLSHEAVYSYSTLTSAFTWVFEDGIFDSVEAEKGSLGLTIALAGDEPIPLDDDDPSFEQNGTPFTLTVTDTSFTNIKWYLNEGATAVSETDSYTPNAALDVKTHFVTITAMKNGTTYIYSKIVQFTVTAAVSGAPAGYTAVDSAETLKKIGVDAAYPLSGKYYQTASFSVSNPWTPIGSSDERFTGEYDGAGKTITPNISATDANIGIFGYADGATFKDIHIGAGSMTATATEKDTFSIGGIAVSAQNNTTFTNCSNAATLIGTDSLQVGGICAYLGGSSTIDHCWNTGAITGGTASVGGICSNIHTSTVKNCYNSGSMNGLQVGGIAGEAVYAEIIACYNTGTVTETHVHEEYEEEMFTCAGGIVGYTYASNQNFTTIIACYNKGDVSSAIDKSKDYSIRIGGVVGCSRNRNGAISAITASYSAGNVSYTGNGGTGNVYIGGIVGGDYDANATAITACYWAGTGADNGIGGASPADTGTAKFGASWISAATEWGIGDGSGSGKYWKSLGSWNSGSPTYPTLWFEN